MTKSERKVRKASERLAYLVDKMISENYSDGIRPSTFSKTEDALVAYKEAISEHDYLNQLKNILK